MSRFTDKVTDINFRGYSALFRDVLAPELQTILGMPVIIEPNPIVPAEPHLRITFTGIDFNLTQPKVSSYGYEGYDLDEVYTIEFKTLLSLNAQGDGPDTFLDEVVKASFRANFVFREHVCIAIMPKKFSCVLFPKKIDRGHFFKNEEPGKKPYIYEENWDATILLPYIKT